jgi:hypothetical protein
VPCKRDDGDTLEGDDPAGRATAEPEPEPMLEPELVVTLSGSNSGMYIVECIDCTACVCVCVRVYMYCVLTYQRACTAAYWMLLLLATHTLTHSLSLRVWLRATR